MITHVNENNCQWEKMWTWCDCQVECFLILRTKREKAQTREKTVGMKTKKRCWSCAKLLMTLNCKPIISGKCCMVASHTAFRSILQNSAEIVMVNHSWCHTADNGCSHYLQWAMHQCPHASMPQHWVIAEAVLCQCRTCHQWFQWHLVCLSGWPGDQRRPWWTCLLCSNSILEHGAWSMLDDATSRWFAWWTMLHANWKTCDTFAHSGSSSWSMADVRFINQKININK